MTERRRWMIGLIGCLLVALACGRSARAQTKPSRVQDDVEDDAPLTMGAPVARETVRSVKVRESDDGVRPLNARTVAPTAKRPILRDDMVRPTQYTPAIRPTDDPPSLSRGELNIAPPIYERYATTSGQDRPLRFDYLFFGRAGVHAPAGGSVLMQELNASYRFRIPFYDSASIRVQPFFNVLFLNGPTGHDPVLPPQVYKLASDVELGYRWSESVLLAVAVTPGIWSDFRGIDADDFRIPARAILAYKVHDGLYFSGGVIYTDNFYHNLLPTVGVIWDATDRWRFELVAPRGKIIYKLHEELQIYGAMEGGGDTYTVRTDGNNGMFQYRDLRFLIGAEIATWERASILLETGLTFNRRFRVEGQEARNLDNAFFLRAGARF